MEWVLFLFLSSAWPALMLILLVTQEATRRQNWRKITGEVDSFYYKMTTLTSGVRYDLVVVIRLDDGREIHFTRPPVGGFRVGDRIERGMVIRRANAGPQSGRLAGGK